MLPLHVLGGCWGSLGGGAATPLCPERRCFPGLAPNNYRAPIIPMLQPAGENRNARPSIGQRTTDDRPLIRQLIIFRMAIPIPGSAEFLPRADSAESLLFSWPRDLNRLHTGFIFPQTPYMLQKQQE